MDPIHFFVTLFLMNQFATAENSCQSPQYVQLGTKGRLFCSFEDFHSLLWYSPSDVFPDSAVILLEGSAKSGRGYLSGEYDIYPNGTLIINNVSLKHEGAFKVVKLDTLQSTASAYVINVSIISQSFSFQPIIDKCDHENGMCFQTLNQNSEVLCFIRDAPILLSLAWVARTIEGDRYILSNSFFTNDTQFYSSGVTSRELFTYSSMLSLLVCTAKSPPSLLKKNETLVFVQNHNETNLATEPIPMFIMVGSTLALKCLDDDFFYFVWQVRNSREGTFSNIFYGLLLGQVIEDNDDADYKLNNSALLIVKEVKVRHEGEYRCISSNGFADKAITYGVIVFVPPTPPYIVVDGCDLQQYCVIETDVEGSLTCTLSNIRPQVELQCSEIAQVSSVLFYDKKLTFKDNGDTFDVTLTLKYTLNNVILTRHSIECKVIGSSNIELLHLSTKFDLLLLHAFVTSTEETIPSVGHYRLLFFVIPAVLVIIVLCVLIICKGYLKSQRLARRDILPEEVFPLMVESDLAAKKRWFIFELKTRYKDLYEAVQPIPYIRDRLYCVDRVFVEGGIQYLVETEGIGGQGLWESLDTYQNILNDLRVKSERRIIEGEPGYGKSTITLQFAYDWSNEVSSSYLKNTDILILLRLRQLGGVTSIYRAIKQFLLPKDSQLSETDIQNIICQSSSVVIILDGYDEYPDQDTETVTDVMSIITRKMFQQCEVVLTTRSACLPKELPGLTKRLKLTGFDDTSRDEYIRKAVVGDDADATKRIKQMLKENPVLGDLCQVPLFFVMFAHVSHESKQFQKFSSVTSFFRYMISCFHSHMKNKMKDENVKKCDLFENCHKELDKLAFEGLSGKNQQIAWSKEHLCDKLGQEFYDQYVRIGILVEEEVLDFSQHIQYKTEARFYHKLFCEWYAAYYLSENVSENDLNSQLTKTTMEKRNNDFFKNLNLLDVQYVYIFACGLNPKAGEKIVEYLQIANETARFAILCILEQEGELENVLHIVENLCSREVRINEDDSLLLQRSTIQLLQIAATNNISIFEVNLFNCYYAVDLPGGNHLQLKSSLPVPVLVTLNKLWLEAKGKKLSPEEFAGILQYASKCPMMKAVWFFNCLAPNLIRTDSVSPLRTRNVKIMWHPWPNTWYRLNLTSCCWESDVENGGDGSVMTNQVYQKEVVYFNYYHRV